MVKLRYLLGKIKYIHNYIIKMGLFQTLKFLYCSNFKQSLQKYKIKNCTYPIFIRGMTSDKESFEKIFILEEYNIKYLEFYNPIIIDAGSNCGHYALFIKNKFPKSKIIVIEPENSNIEILKKNLEKIENVDFVFKGLWSKKTNLSIKNIKNEKYSFQVYEDDKGTILATSLQDIIKKFKLNKIDILKMDIEGSEKKIFEENTSAWKNKVNIILVEPHDKYVKNCEKTIKNFAKKNNFNIIKKGENLILKKKINTSK
ncbi:MAG: FkbM family methyltransferase [archaeon]